MRTVGEHDQLGVGLRASGLLALARILDAEHQRVERDAVAESVQRAAGWQPAPAPARAARNAARSPAVKYAASISASALQGTCVSVPTGSRRFPKVVIVRSRESSTSVTALLVGSSREAASTCTPNSLRRAAERRPWWSSARAVQSVEAPAKRANCTAATAPPPAGSSKGSRACTTSPARGIWDTRAKRTHSTCPTTATRGARAFMRGSVPQAPREGTRRPIPMAPRTDALGGTPTAKPSVYFPRQPRPAPAPRQRPLQVTPRHSPVPSPGRYSRASSNSLVTVFQLRAVAITPKRFSKKA